MITIKAQADSNGFLSFKCPFCNKIHKHGIGEGPRASHCRIYTEDYYLTTQTTQKAEVQQ